MASFSIKVSSSPHEVGVWLQSILLANPTVTFAIGKIDRDIVASPVNVE